MNLWCLKPTQVKSFFWQNTIVILLTLIFPYSAVSKNEIAIPFYIRTIPEDLQDWNSIKSFVLDQVNKNNMTIIENGTSLNISDGRNNYQIMLYNSDVIQYSSWILENDLQITESIQFGRSPDRSIKPYLAKNTYLAWAYSYLTEKLGIIVKELGMSKGIDGHRSALILPKDEGTAIIELSARYAKHPIFGFAHESQHLLNQTFLSIFAERHFPMISLRERVWYRSFIDEYLAVHAEVQAYQELISLHPHLANEELTKLERMTESELKSYVYSKWKSFYSWPASLEKMILSRSLDAVAMLKEVRDFNKKFGAQEDLTKKKKNQLLYEQKRNPKILDESIIASPKNLILPWLYRPEAGMSFPIRTLWIPESQLAVAKDLQSLPENLEQEIIHAVGGDRLHAFFIHPLSEERFSDLIRGYQSTFDFVATPTSSNRTLLIRSIKSGQVFYVKTSLAVTIAGMERLVPAAEVSRSVGHSMFLKWLASQDKRVLYLPEILAQIPQGLERGGQVIRLAETNQVSQNLVPLFSFYDLSNGDFTGKLANAQGLSRYQFLRTQLVQPLYDLLQSFKVKYHFVHEVHAQNILVEVDESGFPTGRFVFKDLAGITIDFSKYPEMAKKMPWFKNFAKEYYQSEVPKAFKQSMEIFFKSGFLFGIDDYLKKMDPDYSTQPSLLDLNTLKWNRLHSSNSFKCQNIFQ